jgi:hypothetical protein
MRVLGQVVRGVVGSRDIAGSEILVRATRDNELPLNDVMLLGGVSERP